VSEYYDLQGLRDGAQLVAGCYTMSVVTMAGGYRPRIFSQSLDVSAKISLVFVGCFSSIKLDPPPRAVNAHYFYTVQIQIQL
jgi:hypothetical protein